MRQKTRNKDWEGISGSKPYPCFMKTLVFAISVAYMNDVA